MSTTVRFQEKIQEKPSMNELVDNPLFLHRPVEVSPTKVCFAEVYLLIRIFFPPFIPGFYALCDF